MPFVSEKFFKLVARIKAILLYLRVPMIVLRRSGTIAKICKKKTSVDVLLLAENTGFEPADALTSTVFKTAALNHSANSPRLFCVGQKTVATVCQNETHGLILSFVGSTGPRGLFAVGSIWDFAPRPPL